MEYEKILKIAQDEKVELGKSFKDFLHTKLTLGHTRYVVRNGVLGDGHERFGAQRYFAAIKEMWSYSNAIEDNQIAAMEAQADLIEAQEGLQKAISEAEKLRAEARVRRAKKGLIMALVSAEDLLRQLDEANKVRMELEPSVIAKYPGGIEEAEADHWNTVYKYRMLKQEVPGMAPERLDNIPLDPVAKARLGIEFKRMDAVAPLIVANEETFNQIPNEDPHKLIKLIQHCDKQAQFEQLEAKEVQ